jgi:hypothetical protein
MQITIQATLIQTIVIAITQTEVHPTRVKCQQ